MKYPSSIILALFLFFSSCRKYDEGGLHYQARQNLYSNSGVWYIEKFEVNGFDSININFSEMINVRNEQALYRKPIKLEDYKLTFVKVKLFEDYPHDRFLNWGYDGMFTFSSSNDKFVVFGQGSASCLCVDPKTKGCPRNIFVQDFNTNHNPYGLSTIWDIKKFTKNEIVLICNLKNSYLIKLIKKP